jgi:hypothetical protein
MPRRLKVCQGVQRSEARERVCWFGGGGRELCVVRASCLVGWWGGWEGKKPKLGEFPVRGGLGECARIGGCGGREARPAGVR